MVYLRILHAKNQHPRPKTVAHRPWTDTKNAKNSSKWLKIAISRSNFIISKKTKKNAFRGVSLKILRAKNRPSKSKTLAYIPCTDIKKMPKTAKNGLKIATSSLNDEISKNKEMSFELFT